MISYFPRLAVAGLTGLVLTAGCAPSVTLNHYVQQIDARYTGIRGNLADFSGAGRDLGFPDVTGCMEPGRSTGEPEAEPAPSVQDSPAAQRGGLLDQLRDEVAQRQHGVNVASLDAERLRARLDRSLRAVFDYCRELTTQLNFLQPQVSRCYYLLDSDDPINKLAWQEGYADFRTRANGEGGNIERVSLAYTLQGPGRRTVEWAGGAVERLRQMLCAACRPTRISRRWRSRPTACGSAPRAASAASPGCFT